MSLRRHPSLNRDKSKSEVEKLLDGAGTILKYGFVGYVAVWICGLCFAGFCVFSIIHFIITHW